MEHPEFEQYYPDLANSKKLSFMSPKKKPKKEVSKTILTAPKPSESTPAFEKIIRINERIPLSELSPTKYSMSSKDWSEMSKRVDSLISGEHNENISINF